jgi:hypothetical protein
LSGKDKPSKEKEVFSLSSRVGIIDSHFVFTTIYEKDHMKHIIITRCKFGKDEDFQKYFEVMKKTYIPSINSQTDKNFSIALIVNPRHYDLIRDEINKDIEIVKFVDQQEDYKDLEVRQKIDLISFSDTKKDYKDFVVKNNITIQTRHDCDDVMSPNYIEYIHKLYNENKSKYDDFILNFHPIKLIVETGKEYTHARDYSKVCSMFSTLIQKSVKHGIMDCVHDHLKVFTRNIIYIPRGYVKLGIHGNNTISKLRPEDKPLNETIF